VTADAAGTGGKGGTGGTGGRTVKQPMSRRSWSTTDVADSEALAYWSELVGEAIARVEIRTKSEAPFEGRFEHAFLDGIGLSTVATGAQRVARTKRQITRDQDERMLAVIQTSGRCLALQDGRSAALEPGTMTILDSARPSSLESFGPSSQIVVQVRRALLLGQSLTGVTALPLDDRGPGRLVSDFIVGLDRKQRDDPVAAAALLPHAVGLLESVLAWSTCGSATATPRSAAALARERIHLFVRQHIDDPDLDAAIVAAACRLSSRSVSRALADDRDTLPALIRRLRVERARRILRNQPNLPLAAVAARSGFGGPAQLHQAFQRIVGTTPGAYRTAAQMYPEPGTASTHQTCDPTSHEYEL
jgi:AraC-like DNA-binding protein